MPLCQGPPLSSTCTATFILEMLTFVTATRPHTWLKILCVGAGNAQVQLGLQHPLPHPLALFTCGRAAGRPGRPVGVDAGLWSVICRAREWAQITQPALLKLCFSTLRMREKPAKPDLPLSPPGRYPRRCRPHYRAQCCTVPPVGKHRHTEFCNPFSVLRNPNLFGLVLLAPTRQEGNGKFTRSS